MKKTSAQYHHGRRTTSILSACVICLVALCIVPHDIAVANDAPTNVPASHVYTLDDDSKYDIADAPSSDSDANGTLQIAEQVDEGSRMGYLHIKPIRIRCISRMSLTRTLRNAERANGTSPMTTGKRSTAIKLDDKVRSGAILIQTSLDGTTWIDETAFPDAFCRQNGAIVLRSQRRPTAERLLSQDTGRLQGWNVKSRTRRFSSSPSTITNAEKWWRSMCSMYMANPTASVPRTLRSNSWDRRSTPGRTMGTPATRASTSMTRIMDGTSAISSSTDTRARRPRTDGTPVFLKNVNDQVTLWFHLSEDISALNGDDALTINEDTNGYDKAFEVDKTNFKHGALIIQSINSKGEASKPIIYTDYLAANARTGADTKVQLFEEGDYSVSLDYEIESKGGIFNAIPSSITTRSCSSSPSGTATA